MSSAQQFVVTLKFKTNKDVIRYSMSKKKTAFLCGHYLSYKMWQHKNCSLYVCFSPPVAKLLNHHWKWSRENLYVEFELHLQIELSRQPELYRLCFFAVQRVSFRQPTTIICPNWSLDSSCGFDSNGNFAYPIYRNNRDGICRNLFCGDACHRHYRDHRDAYDVCLKHTSNITLTFDRCFDDKKKTYSYLEIENTYRYDHVHDLRVHAAFWSSFAFDWTEMWLKTRYIPNFFCNQIVHLY